MISSLSRWASVGIAALLLLGAAWLWGPAVWGRMIDATLKERVAQYQQETEAAKQEAAAERERFLTAKTEAARAKANADRFADQAKRLGAERDELLSKVQSATAELERIRADVAKVPASELLGHIRRALVQLRGPGPGG